MQTQNVLVRYLIIKSLVTHIELCAFYCRVNYIIFKVAKPKYLNAFRSCLELTVKNKTYSPAKFSSYSFGKADALKKLTEEGHFSDFFIRIR
ncbi:hypothetical protein CFB3_28040 [Clostridium folliculivorans]|uniref:Uncharacterized protein n=1 Tax=Clostridium folliculivorans TaxID=2886038 RepID=A0A9W6D9X8_9CLOT|nr:hypothetical protein CFOLD11_14250 [Clostridium folliculivorans]GKU30697.1 hypothetical protein CFB3_28040 [Clostridium folliculivorans]